MPVPPIIANSFAKIPLLSSALATHETNRVVAAVRVSGTSQLYDGSLYRQERTLSAAIKEAGGRIVAWVGRFRPQNGKLSSGRPDLEHGFFLARDRRAVLCYLSVPRLIRAEEFDPKTNLYAKPTPEEFARLFAMAEGVPFAVILAADLPPEEIHIRATKLGMKQGKKPGRKARK